MRAAAASLCLSVAALWACAAGAQTLDRQAYRAHLASVDAQHDAQRARCKSLEGNERDLCRVRAVGMRHVARAELDARFKPGPKAQERLAIARAEAAHATAREQCDGLRSQQREVCRKDAKAQLAAARADAKTVTAAAPAAPVVPVAPAAPIARAPDAGAELYALGRERCEAMPGTARDSCMADLNRRYGKP